MSVKHMIASGIGFSPGSVKFIVTRGLIPLGEVVYSEAGGADIILLSGGADGETIYVGVLSVMTMDNIQILINDSISVATVEEIEIKVKQ